MKRLPAYCAFTNCLIFTASASFLRLLHVFRSFADQRADDRLAVKRAGRKAPGFP